VTTVSIATGRLTLVGVLCLHYEPSSRDPSVEDVALVLAEVDALIVASLIVFSVYADDVLEPPPLGSVIGIAADYARNRSDSRSLGARALRGFNDAIRPPWQSHLGAIVQRWAHVPGGTLTYASLGSPLNLVIEVPLATAAAVNSFVLLTNAIRRLYRSIREFRLDEASFEAALAEYEADAAVQARRRDAALVGIDRLEPTSGSDLPLTEVEADIRQVE